ncbi:MAG: right-handed parallel beta-helix repeat-containing protein [bacterium]
MASTSDLSAGDWLWIRQDNDPVAMATIRDIPDYEASIDNDSGWAARVVGQVVQISSVTAGGVVLEQPLHLDFTWPNPTAQKLGPASGIGFEDFTLDNGLGSAGRFNFDFSRTVNCWIKNVHSNMAMRSHVAASGSANLEVRNSYFNDAYRHDGGGHGYGVQLLDTTTHSLVVNNVFRNLRHAMIWKEGANGNVYAYNYSTDGNQAGSAVAKDISGHGHYAFGNLIEGNIAQFIHASDYWGPIGPNNTFLRNRTTEERILIEDGTQNQNILGNELVSPTSPFVVIDGTSTGAYVHGNNEGGSLQWRSGEPQTVVASYFYSSRPGFWNISDPWPSIGPEQVPGTFTIPAQQRWDSGQMMEFPSSSANGRLSNLSTRGQVLSGNDILIAGFVISGTADQTLLLRGIGPALNDFLDPDSVLRDSQLTVFNSAQEAILSNDNWSDQPDPANVAAVTAAVGGFALADNSRDAALVATLSPGAYSMHLSGNNGTGIALAEIYDASGGTNAQLLNISTRGRVGSGDTVMVPGIVVTDSSRRLLIRGVGPELATSFGFDPDTILPDPVLTLTSSSGQVLASNDNWEDGSPSATAEIVAVAAEVGAFTLTSGGGDAVLLVTLPPGVYTAQVTDANTGEGIAIVEVYAVSE